MTALPAHGTLSDTGPPTHAITADEATAGYTLAGHTVDYRPDANYSDGDSFTYKVNDGQADSPTATVNLFGTPVADATTTTYTGASKGYAANKSAKLVLSAQLTSPDPACVAGRAVTFTFDKDPTPDTVTPFTVGTAVSGATGSAILSVSTSSWTRPGIYEVTVTTSASEGCLGSSSSASLTLQAKKVKGR